MKQNRFLDTLRYTYNVRWVKGTNDLEFSANNGIVVQNDILISDKICVRPTSEYPICIVIPWKLVAKDFTERGTLRVVLNTTVMEKNSIVTYPSYFEDEVILQNYTGHDDD
jgi:hypothetical protein